MNENVVYVVTEKDTGMFLNVERRSLQPDMNFQCFFPSEETARHFRSRSLSDSQGRHFDIRELEIVEFLNNQLTVAYENDNVEELPPF